MEGFVLEQAQGDLDSLRVYGDCSNSKEWHLRMCEGLLLFVQLYLDRPEVSLFEIGIEGSTPYVGIKIEGVDRLVKIWEREFVGFGDNSDFYEVRYEANFDLAKLEVGISTSRALHHGEFVLHP